jgi:hypothetical protein
MLKNTSVIYPVLLMKSTEKRSLSTLGKIMGVSGKTVKKMLRTHNKNLDLSRKTGQELFKNNKKLTLAVDDTLVQKRYAKEMVGVGDHFDTSLYRKISGYRLIAAVVTNGFDTVPIDFDFLFGKELLSNGEVMLSKLDFIKRSYGTALKTFPDKQIYLAADGLFSSEAILAWCKAAKILANMRIHANRRVIFKGESCKLNEIKDLIPRGRQRARTAEIIWRDIHLYVTAEKRVSKNGTESVVYIVSTYKARPIDHVEAYKRRWPIEKCFRTTKQYLGLKECFSTDLETQRDHISAVFLAYAIAHLEKKRLKFDTPEMAIKAVKQQDWEFANNRIARSVEIFGGLATALS